MGRTLHWLRIRVIVILFEEARIVRSPQRKHDINDVFFQNNRYQYLPFIGILCVIYVWQRTKKYIHMKGHVKMLINISVKITFTMCLFLKQWKPNCCPQFAQHLREKIHFKSNIYLHQIWKLHRNFFVNILDWFLPIIF